MTGNCHFFPQLPDSKYVSRCLHYWDRIKPQFIQVPGFKHCTAHWYGTYTFLLCVQQCPPLLRWNSLVKCLSLVLGAFCSCKMQVLFKQEAPPGTASWSALWRKIRHRWINKNKHHRNMLCSGIPFCKLKQAEGSCKVQTTGIWAKKSSIMAPCRGMEGGGEGLRNWGLFTSKINRALEFRNMLLREGQQT